MCSIIIQLVMIIAWGAQLMSSDAYYVNYTMLFAIVCLSVYKNFKAGDCSICKRHGKYENVILYLFAALFSTMVAASNYKIYAFRNVPADFGMPFPLIYRSLLTVIFFLGGFFAFEHVFNVIVSGIKKTCWNPCEKTYTPRQVFIISFAILVFTRWLVLHFCQYPGELTPDSISQMEQLLTNVYSNHHPFYHTMVIKAFINLGMKLFGDINAAVATYSCFQILFTAMCFSFAVSTMAMMKAPKWIMITSMLFYIMMPYHIIYAITMWKDIMFGCFILLLVIFTYRCLCFPGKRVFDYVMLTISSFGTCLFRSNGFFAFVILTIAFLALWKLRHKKIVVVFISAVVISFVMKHAVLAGLGVTQPDTIESLSIPAQQIARVIVGGEELEDWQKDLLEKVIDIEKIPESYKPFISDPIKNLVRDKGNQQYISEHKGEFIKLYISLGLKNPLAYVYAWIDQTRGYWNAGYSYWRWFLGVLDNDLGIERTTRSVVLDTMLSEYLWMFEDMQVLRIFLSIGLFVWIDIVMLMIGLLRKDKASLFAALPVLVVVASLLVATPVHSEFRYIYAVFCALPMVMVIALRPEVKREDSLSSRS